MDQDLVHNKEDFGPVCQIFRFTGPFMFHPKYKQQKILGELQICFSALELAKVFQGIGFWKISKLLILVFS